MRKWVLKTTLAAVAILALSASGAALDEDTITINATVLPYAILGIPTTADLEFKLTDAASLKGYAYEASTDVSVSIATNTPVSVVVTRDGGLPAETMSYSAWDIPLLEGAIPVDAIDWSGNVRLNARFTVSELSDVHAATYKETLTVTVSAREDE